MGLPSDTLEYVPQKSEPDVRPTLNVLANQKTGVPRGSIDETDPVMTEFSRRNWRQAKLTSEENCHVDSGRVHD
jgi:hypothetical protein